MDKSDIVRELYLPATDWQIRDFTNVLAGVRARLSQSFNDVSELSMELKVSFGDAQKSNVMFDFEDDGEKIDYGLMYTITQPIDGSWSVDAAKAILDDAYMGYNQHYDKDENTGDLDEGDDGEVVEGYLEHEVAFTFTRLGPQAIVKKTISCNIFDDEDELVNSHMVYHPEITIPQEPTDDELEELLASGTAILDIASVEDNFGQVSSADLIICTHVLACAGMLRHSRAAYRGAPAYGDISLSLVPRTYIA